MLINFNNLFVTFSYDLLSQVYVFIYFHFFIYNFIFINYLFFYTLTFPLLY